ncbi:MAG: HU family DNA-binding protein [Polyangiaceae bacterium]
MAEKKKRLTKAEIITTVAESSELDKKSVNRVFEGLTDLIKKELKKKGEFVIPGLLKLRAKKVPASKGGEKRPNPFKPGEFIVTKPKAASVKVRASILKALKDGIG